MTVISAICFSGPAAFRPRAQSTSYVSSVEKGRPVLQGLLAIAFLAEEVLHICYEYLFLRSLIHTHTHRVWAFKFSSIERLILLINISPLGLKLKFLLQVLGWAQALPKFAAGLVSYVQSFLERAYERCRTSYMEAMIFPLLYSFSF